MTDVRADWAAATISGSTPESPLEEVPRGIVVFADVELNDESSAEAASSSSIGVMGTTGVYMSL